TTRICENVFIATKASYQRATPQFGQNSASTAKVGLRLEMELVAEGFSFPTSLTFDDGGSAYIAESGLPLDGLPPGGRIWRIDRAGACALLLDGLRPPVTGLVFHRGSLYISEGGHPGRISSLDNTGSHAV